MCSHGLQCATALRDTELNAMRHALDLWNGGEGSQTGCSGRAASNCCDVAGSAYGMQAHRSPNSICRCRRVARCTTRASACLLSNMNSPRNTANPVRFMPRFAAVLSDAPAPAFAASLEAASRLAIAHEAAPPPSSASRSGRGRKYSRKYFGSRSSFSIARICSAS